MIDIDKIKKQTREFKDAEKKHFEENLDLSSHLNNIEELMEEISKKGGNQIEYSIQGLSTEIKLALANELIRLGKNSVRVMILEKDTLLISWTY